MTPYHELAAAKDNLRQAKDHEQTVRAITEHTTPTTGRNAEDRKRELIVALSQDGIYTRALFELREAEAHLDLVQAAIDQADTERRDREWQVRADLARALAGRNEDDLPGYIQDRQLEQSARLRIVQSTRQSVDDLYGEEPEALYAQRNPREL